MFEGESIEVSAEVDASGELLCAHCGEAVMTGEMSPVQNTPMHRECAFRLVTGGVNHILKRCTCFGGSEPSDPPGLTKRGAAAAALAAWDMTNGGNS